MPYFSIIMAVYNNEKYLPVAVESIKNQTFIDWELIIVDDGSTDRTPEIADKLAESDNRIRVIHQENQWIFRSYNNGYAAAKGKYVFIVNSDDTINAESLQNIYNVAEIDNADLIMFNLQHYKCDDNQNIKEIIQSEKVISDDFSCADIDDIHSKWIDYYYNNWIRRQCVYKSEIAKKQLYKPDLFGGDAIYNLYIADKIKVIAATSYTVYNHYIYIESKINASDGKYYGYEHDMFNEMYLLNKELALKWGKWDEHSKSTLLKIRMWELSFELSAYMSQRGCKLNINEKLEKIMSDLSDNLIYNCAKELDRLEEYESRILSGLRQLFLNEVLDENSKYYFFYELLDKLLAYEKTEDDMEIIHNAVYNPLNPHNIGECFYKKLTGERENRNV